MAWIRFFVGIPPDNAALGRVGVGFGVGILDAWAREAGSSYDARGAVRQSNDY